MEAAHAHYCDPGPFLKERKNKRREKSQLQRGSITGNFTIFEQNEVTIPLFIYKVILSHQEIEIHQGL